MRAVALQWRSSRRSVNYRGAVKTSRSASTTRRFVFWIDHLKLAESLHIKDIAKRLNLFQVNIARRGTKANLADVGFGVSQILPVLVQGLLMRKGRLYCPAARDSSSSGCAGRARRFFYLSRDLWRYHHRRNAQRVSTASSASPSCGRRETDFYGVGYEKDGATPLKRGDVAILYTGL